jgi:hypothetical protein
MRLRSISAFVLATIGGLGCNSGALPSDDVVILPDALTCASSSWNVVHDFGELGFYPGGLNVRDGMVYVSIDGLGIISMPAAGGEPTVLTPDLAHNIWLRGDDLFYTTESEALMRLPVAGGTPTLVFDPKGPSMTPSQWVTGVALDADYFHWTTVPQDGVGNWQLWRTARATGASEQVATLPANDPGYPARFLAASAETVFVTPGAQNVTYAMPLGGGALRTLRPPPMPAGASANPLGANDSGLLWSVQSTADPPLATKTVIGLSDLADPLGAAARPFWTSKPVGMQPVPGVTFADGDRGWIVTGMETLADGSLHVSVWSVDTAGKGMRLGCGPALPARNPFGEGVGAAVTPDAIYVMVLSFQDLPAQHSDEALVRFDRPQTVSAAP